MPCIVQIKGQDLEIQDVAVAKLIGAAVNVVTLGTVAAVHLFNAAEDSLRIMAIREHGNEPWLAFLSPEAEEMNNLLLRIGLKPVVKIPPLKPLGAAPRHEMKAGCGGDSWGNQD